METLCPIRYRTFWDFPREFLVFSEPAYFVICGWDDDLEDWEDFFRVYLVEGASQEQLNVPWPSLDLPKSYLGWIPVRAVEFDPTKRRLIRMTFLEKLEAGEKADAPAKLDDEKKE